MEERNERNNPPRVIQVKLSYKFRHVLLCKKRNLCHYLPGVWKVLHR